MHFAKAFVFAAIVLAGGAFAAPNPNKPAKPVKPAPPSVDQTNSCGNGTPYCCNGGDGSTANLGTCQAQAFGSTCNLGGTFICCQANDSIQVCLGGATVVA